MHRRVARGAGDLECLRHRADALYVRAHGRAAAAAAARGGARPRAIEGGQAAPDAFFWKLLFTAVTIGSGFKGGEVVPTFFIGATLGCVLGGLLGIPAGFAAALGLVCVFCGAVNCPIASIVLSIELFGAGQLVYFALACGIAYMLSGYFGLYSSQKILYSKLRTEFINIHAK